MKLTASKNNEAWISREIARLKAVEETYRSKISELEAALEALATPAPSKRTSSEDEGNTTK